MIKFLSFYVRLYNVWFARFGEKGVQATAFWSSMCFGFNFVFVILTVIGKLLPSALSGVSPIISGTLIVGSLFISDRMFVRVIKDNNEIIERPYPKVLGILIKVFFAPGFFLLSVFAFILSLRYLV